LGGNFLRDCYSAGTPRDQPCLVVHPIQNANVSQRAGLRTEVLLDQRSKVCFGFVNPLHYDCPSYANRNPCDSELYIVPLLGLVHKSI